MSDRSDTPREQGRTRALEGLLRELGREAEQSPEAYVEKIMQAVKPSGRIPRLMRPVQRRGMVILFRLLLAAAACVVLVVGLKYVRPAAVPGPGRMLSVSTACLVMGRDVSIVRGRETVAAADGTQLFAGDTLSTGPEGDAAFIYAGEATSVALGAASQLRLSDRDGFKRLELGQGELTVHAAPQPAGRPLTVITPHARAEVVGTVFRVQTDTARTRLEVTEGAVQFAGEGGEGPGILVAAGRSAVAMPGTMLGLEPEAPIAAPAAVMLRDSFNTLTAWNITAWRTAGNILFKSSRTDLLSPPAALRLTYTFPGLPFASVDDVWLTNHRTIDRSIQVPAGVTHIRLQVKALSADSDAVFTLSLWDDPREEAWGLRMPLAAKIGAWQRIEAPLGRMPEKWSRAHGGQFGAEVPPLRPDMIGFIEIGLNLGSAEVLVDDIEFVSNGSGAAQ